MTSGRIICTIWDYRESASSEITEDLLLNASTTTKGKLLVFRDANIQIAIDDFSTGYSSLTYLQKLDIN